MPTKRKQPPKAKSDYRNRSALVRTIAQELGVDLKDSVAVCTREKSAEIRVAGDSLKVHVYPDMIEIERKGAPGIEIKVIDPTERSGASEGTIYSICLYKPDENPSGTQFKNMIFTGVIDIGPAGVLRYSPMRRD